MRLFRPFLSSLLALIMAIHTAAPAQTAPAPQSGSWTVKDFRFHTGETLPELKLAYTTLGDPKHILSSLEMGAHGYLLKSEPPEHILHHIITLVNEGGVLSGLASKIVIQEMAQRHPTSAQRSASGTAPAALTPKELRVLSLVQTGLPAKSIAFHLNISIFTVNQHLRSIYRKLNVRNKMEAVQSASNLGLL